MLQPHMLEPRGDVASPTSAAIPPWPSRSLGDVAIDYLRDTAVQTGLDVPHVAIEDVGWNGDTFAREAK